MQFLVEEALLVRLDHEEAQLERKAADRAAVAEAERQAAESLRRLRARQQ